MPDVLYLNDRGDYEVHNSGVFFYSSRSTGKYQKRQDTLYLHDVSKTQRLLKDTMVFKDKALYEIIEDSLVLSRYILIK